MSSWTKGCTVLSKVYKTIFRRAPSYEPCCHAHDKAYAQGGTKVDRKVADVRLLECIKTCKGREMGFWSRLQYRVAGYSIYGAVRAFGGFSWPKSENKGV